MLSEKEIEKIILSGGGEIPPKGVGGTDRYGYFVYFNDPQTKTTLMCPLADLTVELVKRKIKDKRFEFNQAEEAHRRMNLFLWFIVILLVGAVFVIMVKPQVTEKKVTWLDRTKVGEAIERIVSL